MKPSQPSTPWDRQPPKGAKVLTNKDAEVKPDWSNGCENCGARPLLPLTGMCGPCTFGEADTAGGNW